MDSESGFTGPVNLGNPREFTMLELPESVLKIVGSKSKLVFEPLPVDDPKQRQPDISIANDKLDWQPTVELQEGLTMTVEYFDELLGRARDE